MCKDCNDSGLKIIHKQGDIISESKYSVTMYGNTLYKLCDCRIIYSDFENAPKADLRYPGQHVPKLYLNPNQNVLLI